MSKHDRPCIKVCRYDDDSGWCLGCGMSVREKKSWKRVEGYRAAILESLPARLAALAAEGFVTGPKADGKRRRD
ncbi:DUF1289 domain-containing protein [Roseococcus pinisoli]|uniref:DUF1289 domain-containing protein n=1 Tax=Roseococcus pinisoli TaxID=2835040 RepID=A0ABS5Q9E8_9PROT|nr:DUF1289 domain-containing protein [Roseococcus pinisoli]MBS7810321.1 DUF1289 domain-containing protein [Roseococcus pinisoli]